jgi:hypothetical protein
MNGQRSLIWAGIISVGSLLSFLITIFSDALSIEDGYIAVAIGTMWIILVAFGLLTYTRLGIENGNEMENKQVDQSTSNIMAIGWVVALILGTTVSFLVVNDTNFDQPGITAPLFAISLSWSIGEFWNYINLRKQSSRDLYIGLVFLVFQSLY